MYQFEGLELWREHRSELLREAESGRLARRLRTRRLEQRAAGLWHALFGRAPDALARLRAQGGGGA